jgi:hypothetical protein
MVTRGAGRVSPTTRKRFGRIAAAAHAVPGRIARVYGVPTNATTYHAILGAGIDLIGTKDIEGANRVLARTVQ